MKESVARYADELAEIFASNKHVVFLCGPSLKDMARPGAKLRSELEEKLTDENFEVVLGEDDGLEELREKYHSYAHLNEVKFIRNQCNTVLVIASSVGSFCEIGLFSYLRTLPKNVEEEWGSADIILLVDESYKDEKSYLNEGPAMAVDDHDGKIFYGDLESFDTTKLLERLRRRRAAWIASGKN